MAYNEKLDKLERKLRKFAVRNLMLYIIGGMLAAFLIGALLYTTKGIDLISYMSFDRNMILQGQVWRVVTFLFVPEGGSIFMLISLYLYWMMGSALEREWGTVKFNLFYLCTWLCTVVAGFIVGYTTNMFINMSLFFAFAILYPDLQFMLFFCIPIKAKWLAIIDAVYYLYMFIVGGWYIRAAILACAVALAIFFSGDVIESIRRAKRRADWKRNFK